MLVKRCGLPTNGLHLQAADSRAVPDVHQQIWAGDGDLLVWVHRRTTERGVASGRLLPQKIRYCYSSMLSITMRVSKGQLEEILCNIKFA